MDINNLKVVTYIVFRKTTERVKTLKIGKIKETRMWAANGRVVPIDVAPNNRSGAQKDIFVCSTSFES